MNEPTPPAAQAGDLRETLYPATSRYHGMEVRQLTRRDGRRVAYLARRFVPQPDRFELLQEHTVADGDRLDNIAADYLGDPEQFWRICDANHELDPGQLTRTAGRRLRITLPEGIPGNENHYA